ncbi:sigma-E factor negative regulatory protein [Azomonas macrocytogenes]|uniref:Sigma-E factor negative regulatory protein RseA n=1 Tax=Azomonas macrocytogenes TaxID=69962 RepID=A0A839T4F2_AZOMA|nr:RseA family anti-sigma factor [Azomonas macrocytogenes]MBB3104417.1 sigma-E factor negative regulatory protein RseA [Azomonas macrocytogenes]
MSCETLHESLSAVMDNEADELELRRVLATTSESETRSTWLRYQIARAAMHKELEPVDFHLDISSAVAAAIAAEDALQAPMVAPAKKGFSLRGFGRVAIAASVTLAVLAGVRLYNQNDTADMMAAQQTMQPSLNVSQQQVQAPAVTVGYSEPYDKAQVAGEAGKDEWHEQRLPSYIRQHAQQATGMEK